MHSASERPCCPSAASNVVQRRVAEPSGAAVQPFDGCSKLYRVERFHVVTVAGGFDSFPPEDSWRGVVRQACARNWTRVEMDHVVERSTLRRVDLCVARRTGRSARGLLSKSGCRSEDQRL